MLRHHRSKRSSGQALVEFALAATLIFTLLSAAIDLGLMFFTFQGLRVAAQEGATYGSHPLVLTDANGAPTEITLPVAEIKNRVRYSGGATPGGFLNLLDLNNDGVTDTQTVIDSYIIVSNPRYAGDNLTVASTGQCETTTPSKDMRKAGEFCYAQVTVFYDYKFIFPLAPVFGSSVRLRASFLMHVRSSFSG